MKKYTQYLLVLALLLGSASLSAQDLGKKKLKPEDYGMWHTLLANDLSPDGRWASYRHNYESGMDTLFVKNVADGRKYSFPKASQGRFASTDSYAFISESGMLCVLKMESAQTLEIQKVSDFMPLGKGRLFAEYNSGAGKSLYVISLEGNTIWSAPGITDYAISDDGGAIAYGQLADGRYSASVIPVAAIMKRPALLVSGELPLEVFSWDRQGNSIAFAAVEKDAGNRRATRQIYHYDSKKKRLSVADGSISGIPEDMYLAPALSNDFQVSDDGNSIFISLSWKKNQTAAPSGPQVWNTLDRTLYGSDKISPWKNRLYLAVWKPRSRKVLPVVRQDGENAFLTGDQRYAVVFDHARYEPSVEAATERDIYLVDLDTGKREIFLERFSGHDRNLNISPGGKYVAYFWKGDWWLYDIRSKSRKRATRKEEASLYETGHDYPFEPLPAGDPVWSLQDREMFYYDAFDLWKLDVAKGIRTRLTRGREAGMAYRLYNAETSPIYRFQKGALSPADGNLLLKGTKSDYSESGFFLLKEGRADTLVYGAKKYSRILFSGDRSAFSYIEETYGTPRAMMVKSNHSASEAAASRSNPQQASYLWGKTALVRYSNASGIKLNGVLYYPQAYDPSRTYPMVVHVYQKQSSYLHDNVNPTLYSPGGFNPTLLSAEGYFVLLPDIIYETGNPGRSAVDCVQSAVEAAITMAPVDRKRLGIIGASFGGFETNFIITQSDLFAAAVGGSSINDFVSGYFSINGNDTRSDAWRYEADQPRMDSSPFENWEGYALNSPLFHVAKLSTPLLLWCGLQDGQVNPLQTMEMYLGLRRLGKQGTMLLYEKEDHALADPENQRDLTGKVMDWFGYHLEGKPEPEWAKPRK